MIKNNLIIFAVLVLSACGKTEPNRVEQNPSISISDESIIPVQSTASAAEMESAAAKLREMADSQESKKTRDDAFKPNSSWSYEETRDAMTDAVTKTAALQSDNSLSLDFPYQGPNFGLITVRQHPRHGLDIIISIQRGQTLCLVTGCTVMIRFDDGKPVRFHANGPADHSSETVFLANVAGFLSSARKAKRIRVILPLYREPLKTPTPRTDCLHPSDARHAPAPKCPEV